MFRQLARVFNINIHIVDEAGFNGKYEDGEVYLSVQADRDLPYIFAHEITHHMQKYAPVEYNELKELVRQAWAEKGGIDEAVDIRIAQYAEKGVQLTYEDALDEIIADSTYEMIQDESFAEELCSENRNLAQKLLDAIKNVLSKLRQVLAEGDGFTPAQNAALLSQLDIFKDAEKLWMDGLVKAAENRDAAGTEHGENAIRYSKKGDNESSVRVQLRTNLDKIADMESVANVKYESMKHLSRSQKAQTIMEDYNKKFKGGVQRENFGFIVLRGDEVTGSLKYLHTDGEYAAFKALPQVLKRGKIIDEHIDHKRRNIDTVTIAAPVIINDTLGYMAAVVKVGGKNRYHVHRILMPDGSEFEFNKKTEPIGAGMSTQKSKQGSAISSVSINSISQTSKKDNEKFSLKEPVEERGNLIALHNISADNLLSTLKLGGFPMPSIAITKTDIGHTSFGDISLIFDKDTIDPEKSGNRVYAADAWTPTFPTVEYELDDSKAYKRANDVGSLTFFNPVTLNEANLKSAISGQSLKSAEEQLIDRFKKDYGLKNMYLAETSEPVKMVRTEKEKYSPERVDELKKYIDELGIDTIKKIRKEHDTSSEDFTRAKKICEEINGREAKALIVNMDLFAALEYSRDGSTEVVDDEAATKKLIDEKVDQKTYEEWLHELFDGIVKNEGIWNGEDPYTRSGDLKDFNKIHMPVTADNIVRAMLGQADDVRNSSNMFLGTRTVRAVAAEEFQSIEGIRKASGKLKNIDTKEYDSVKEELDDRLNDIMHEISDGTRKSDNEFMDIDTLGRGIEEGCRKPTPENFKKVLKDYGWKINDVQAQELADVVNNIADMPVNMFEAKPQRVVGLDEIRTAVIPSDADKSVRTALDDAGIETAEYEAGNEEDRILKVNEAAEQKNVKFSLKNENLSPDARIPYTVHRSYIAVKKNDTAALKKLQDSVKGLSRGTYENKATGYKADINGRTIGKILNPSHNMKHTQWSKKYIENLNAAAYLPELFENAVYVDTKENQKSKKSNQQIQGYHHFVSPVYMDGKEYRVRIVAREKQNSDTLYIVETEIMTIKDGVRKLPGQKPRNLGATPSDISIPDLINGVKIHDYNMQKNDTYTSADIRYSFPDEESIMDYAADHETEFVNVPPIRDYERKARGAKIQTIGELRAQVDKLKAGKKLTKGRVLNRKSVKEQVNDMVVMLKSYGTVDGKKTDTKLVNQATDNIASIYRHIKEGDYPGAVKQAYNAAQDMVDNLHLVEDSMFREYEELRDLMRTTKISISEEDAANILDFKEWKKSQFGRLRISSDGMDVDTFYQVITEKYPELFDYSVSHPADQLQAMADVRESMEPFDILLDSEERSDLVQQAAQDMIDIAATGKPWKSWADRKKESYDEQVKRLKQRHVAPRKGRVSRNGFVAYELCVAPCQVRAAILLKASLLRRRFVMRVPDS